MYIKSPINPCSMTVYCNLHTAYSGPVTLIRVCQQLCRKKRIVVVVGVAAATETTADWRVGLVLGQSVLWAATRADRLSDVRDDRQPEPGRTAGAGRAVAGRPAGRGHGQQGTVDGRAVRPGQPDGRGVLRVPRVRDGGRGGVPGVGRTAGRRPRRPSGSGEPQQPAGRSQDVGGGLRSA